ncbi:hypothetical protein [Caldalkalibacillus mannanilyticus]|uniref:hypothetical protein n=1 Tax=Caldalkalibacillus mannanilyticus TaxID=1418 RepID=UPI000A88E672|nr:hypothetical protein [Caldalkalibacillus mannanilyticus]
MEKKAYSAPQVLSFQAVKFETAISKNFKPCGMFPKPGKPMPPGIEMLCRK